MRQVGRVRIYDTKDLAKNLGLHRVTVQRLMREGRLPGRKMGNAWVISETGFEKYFSRPTNTGGVPKVPKGRRKRKK